MTAPAIPFERSKPWWPAAWSAALAIVLYAHTLSGTFVYDDQFQARDDPRLAEVGRWGRYFTEGYFPGAVDNLWRPLVSLSYAVQFKLHGPWAAGFHLVNVLLHAGASALLAELARRLTGDRRAALIAGLLFAAHPVHAEAVAYIVGRAESMCLLGILGALVLATRRLTVGRALGVVGCVAAAIFSKEQGLLAPVMIAAVLWWRRARGEWLEGERQPALILAVVLAFGLAAYVFYRDRILPWYWETKLLDYAMQPMVRSELRDRVLIPFALLGRYAALVVAPVTLSPDHGLAVHTHEQSWGDPYLWIGFLTVAGAVVAAMVALRRRDFTTLLLLFCAALSYFMVSNVVLIGTIFGERLIYVPSAFLLMWAGKALAGLRPRVLTPVLALLLALYGVRAVTYAAQWGDRLAFYERAAEENPRAVRLHVLLARELLSLGRLERAREVVEKGLAVSQEDWRLWVAAAQVAIAQGRWDDARAAIAQAWKKDPYVGDMLWLENLFETRRAGATSRPF